MSEKYEFVETMLTEPDCLYPVHLMCGLFNLERASWNLRVFSASIG